MRVLFVSSEVYPLAKTGGLADVSEALPRALTRAGADVHVLMPAYACAKAQLPRAQVVAEIGDVLGIRDAQLLAARIPGTELPVWLVDAPELYDRAGLYQDRSCQDWPDNARRYAFLAHVAARLAMGRTEIAWRPDVVHANDWHAGLVPLLLARETDLRPATVFTVHNMAFQGNFPAHVVPELDLPEGSFSAEGIEYYDQASFLKAGIRFADRLTTVSPTYAREILAPEYGFGFDGLLRERTADLRGILNGVDYAIWDPAHDPFIASTYDAMHLNGKKLCKAALQRELGLPEVADTPLIAFISRLTEQKMADVLVELLPRLAETDVQVAVLSEGDNDLEQKFRQTAQNCRRKITVRIGYEEPLAHRMQAGADILLAPARFEPCGLSQIYAMRYGTVPVVRATGGLADTVVDTTRHTISEGRATGFVFTKPTLTALEDAIGRACAFYREPLTWRRLQSSAMKQDFSWNRSAGEYLALYNSVAGTAQGAPLAQLIASSGQHPSLEQAAG